ncbi:hypothetical protein F5050DRAFT_1811334 [Lentinula boryana]|uniref:Uncharacterized protein n=1 Tax=Lentinula boryana TaxID=40481 RepID=A0ABQ8Q1D4_9AGAR|nr:hypothetical protein F5050DRAFT_1811334 [Lentinula boryana]
MNSIESAQGDLAQLRIILDSAQKEYDHVYAEIHPASSENLDSIVKLETSTSKSSSVVHKILLRAIHYEKQCHIEINETRGPISKSVRDGNIVRQLIEEMNSSSCSLNTQLQLVIAQMPDMRNTLAEDPSLAQVIVARLGAITPLTTQKPRLLKTLKNSDIMSMYLSIDTCAKVLEILKADAYKSTTPFNFDSVSSKLNVTKHTTDWNPDSLKSALESSDIQSLETMDHCALGSSPPLNATKPEATVSTSGRGSTSAEPGSNSVSPPSAFLSTVSHDPQPSSTAALTYGETRTEVPGSPSMTEFNRQSDFESPYTRDIDTALRLKRYKEWKMEPLFRSIEALKTEGHASNKRVEEALQTTAHQLIDSRSESFNNKLNCLKNNINTAFNLKDFPRSSQGVIALEFWKGTSLLSQLWEFGRQLLYIQRSAMNQDLFAKLDRFRFERELSTDPWLGGDDGHAVYLRIFRHIGHVLSNNGPEKNSATPGRRGAHHNSGDCSGSRISRSNLDDISSGILESRVSDVAAASVTPILDFSSSKSTEEREGVCNDLPGGLAASITPLQEPSETDRLLLS